jgi:hypothetical protein
MERHTPCTRYAHSFGCGNSYYTLHVHSVVCGRGYTLHVHSAVGGKKYAVHVHFAWCGNGYTLHVHIAGVVGGKRDALYMSKLQVVESDKLCRSIDSC